MSYFDTLFPRCFILSDKRMNNINFKLIDKQIKEEKFYTNKHKRSSNTIEYCFHCLFISMKNVCYYGHTHKTRINCIIQAKPDKILIASEHPTIKYYWLPNKFFEKHILMKYYDHTKSVNSLAVSENGNYFYSASDDCSVIRWNLNEISFWNFQLVFKLCKKQNPKILKFHHDKVNQVLTLKNGLFCSYSIDHTINFYKETNKDLLAPTLEKSLHIEGMELIGMIDLIDKDEIAIVTKDKKVKFINYDDFNVVPDVELNDIECSNRECMIMNKETNELIIGGEKWIYSIDLNKRQMNYIYTSTKIGGINHILLLDNDHYICETNVGFVEYVKKNNVLQIEKLKKYDSMKKKDTYQYPQYTTITPHSKNTFYCGAIDRGIAVNEFNFNYEAMEEWIDLSLLKMK